jgi:phosphoribosylaminoimidazole-succinocarboxamide synthase
MASDSAVFETNLASLPLLYRGKVRDIYEIDADRLLVVQTDRLSAFDIILPTPVPGKGRMLTAMSAFWFRRLAHVIPNHLLDTTPESVVSDDDLGQVESRSMVVRRLTPLPVEAIVRGYVAGSGWKDYQKTQAICGIALPAGLREADKLAEPIFTPSTKAAIGDHDENISYADVEELVGAERAAKVRKIAIQLYSEAAEYAATRGIIIADTKFEFGVDSAGTLYLIDEALTSDSSRFWARDQYRPGTSPPSFDKQFVRNWLEAQNWNKKPPAPALPDDILAKTVAKYEEALRLLTG